MTLGKGTAGGWYDDTMPRHLRELRHPTTHAHMDIYWMWFLAIGSDTTTAADMLRIMRLSKPDRKRVEVMERGFRFAPFERLHGLLITRLSRTGYLADDELEMAHRLNLAGVDYVFAGVNKSWNFRIWTPGQDRETPLVEIPPPVAPSPA